LSAVCHVALKRGQAGKQIPWFYGTSS